MFGGLRKKLNEVWSGLDFYDQKENQQQRQQFKAQRAAPVRTVSQPKQVAPVTTQRRIDDSYGTGFSKYTNKLRDTFDANTKADKIRRFATTGLEETYDEEQARKTKEALASDGNRNSANQFSGAGLGNVVRRVGQLPGAVSQLQGRTIKAFNSIDNPILRTGAKLITPGGASMLFQDDKMGDKLLKTGQNANATIENKVQQSGLGDRKDDNKWIRSGGQLTTDLPLQIASGGAGLLALGAQTTADEANKAQAKGRSNEQALAIGALQGGATALSEKFGIDRFLPGQGSTAGLTTKLVNAGKRFVTEGAQEAQQQFTSNLIANKTYDPTQSLKEGVLQSAVMGGLAGGAMSPFADFSTSRPQDTPQVQRNARPEEYNVLSDYQETLYGNIPSGSLVNQIHKDARQVADRLGIDIVTGSPADISNRINEVLSRQPKVQSLPDARATVPGLTTRLVKPKPLNEGGYIQVPGGKNSTLNDEQLTTINYLNNKPNIEGDATQSEGNALPSDQPTSRRQELLDRMKKLTEPMNEVGAIGRDVRPEGKSNLVLGEKTLPDGSRIQKVRVGRGKIEERTIPAPKQDFPDLQSFDKMIGGQGNIPITQPKPTQDTPAFNAQTGSDAQPTARIDQTIAKWSDSPTLTDTQLSEGKKTRTGLTQGDRGLLRTATDFAGSKLTPRGDGSVQRKLRRTGQYIFGKQFGQDPRMIKATQALSGDATQTDAALLDIGKKAYGLLPDTASRERVHAVLDPETAKKGMNISETNLKPSEAQAVQMLRDIGESINDTSYRMGMISKKKWLENKGGRYIARMYREIETAPDVIDLLDMKDSKSLFTGMYKSREKFGEEMRQRILRDPIKLAVIRARQVRSNEVLDDYMRKADTLGFVSDKPKKGYIKTEYNENLRSWNNRYVRQDVWENVNGFKAMSKGINSMNNVLDVWDGNPARRLRKKMLTIWNPVVRTGNVTSNYFMAYMNGVNPLEYQTGKLWAKKAMKNSKDPLVVAARKAGLTQSNIIRNDKNLFNVDREFFAGLDREAYNNTNSLQRAGRKTVELKDRVTQRYGEADDIAKLAALKAKTDRGVPINKAIEEVRRGFQDYSRVGHLYDMSAKAPVFGNAFIRFQGDLYMHILKNAAIDHPLRLASIPALTLLAGNALSALSGESEEDKKTREGRLGAPKIPFTDISMEFQTPFGAVDAARFTPLYMRNLLNEGGDGGIKDEMNRLLPFNIPGSNDKQGWFKAMASDPLLGPVIQLATDIDWKGKSIKDPEGYRDGKALFPDNPLSKEEQNRNRVQYGLRSFLPYPFNEVGDIMASANEDMRNEQAKPGGKYDPSNPDASFLGRTGYNTSGSKKTVGQATARLFGIRAQEFGADEASKARDDKKMFGFFDKVDEWKNSLNSDTKTAFDARHKGTQTRDGLKSEFESDPWYKYKNASELLQNPKLFDAEKSYAQMQNKYDGKPIDPIFNLPKEQRNLILAKKLKLPGSKDEGFNSLYDQEWYQDFRGKQDKYYKAKSAYAKKMGWSDYESDNPYPEAKKGVQQAMDAYFKLPSGTGERSAFIRNNPDTWAAITGQWDKQNAWTDKEREKLGLPKIDREEDDKKFSYGSGGGGKRGGKRGSKYDWTKDLFASDGSKTTKALRKILEDAMRG